MLISHIVSALERFAPPALQEEYDNCGLILGDSSNECSGVLVTVDVTESVVAEAVSKGCNMIVAHHPIIFKGIRRLNGRTPQERAIISAIRNGIAVYACHTSLDSAPGGVSQRMASMLGLESVGPLEPANGRMLKLQVYVPSAQAEDVRMALFDAGAGEIGNYDSCSYTLTGFGSFRALPGSNPFAGEVGRLHFEKEECIQVVLPSWRRRAVESALLQVHPYEEPAYDFIEIRNSLPDAGLGAVGNLPEPLTPAEIVDLVKTTFGSPVARCNEFPLDARIRRVALCGGSGSSLLGRAIASGAGVMVTSDVKYHDFVDYANDILIVDIGHHESEKCSKSIIFDIISEKFPNFAVRNSQSDVNPIKYM
ncbi:MAG: Nif3-like dinuclear metal center hexameric protein [Paramuribaculum sp.]|nr:Nif3-like dinuclear metal center hexameric protein [Paramuribaculum sp.]MDE6488089.1 Nif3-like dinuclear metal center hexameric protein [Paramuribaculum sp.]